MLDNQTHYLAKTHPFKNDVIRGVITAGQTVSDVLAEMQAKHDIGKYYQATTYVEINGTPIHPDRYDVTFIDRNAIVVIQYCVPQGGGSGSNPLRMVLTIALAAVAMAVPGMLAAGSFFASGLGAGLLSGGIMMVGSMVINAICPATSLSSTGLSGVDSAESSVYSITGMTNYNPAYKPLPIVLGKVRFAPPYGAIPYTRIDGNDQYLHTVVVWGQGELSVTDIKIGETDISEYSDLTIATNYGRSTDTDLGLYPYDVYEDEVGAVVAQATPLTRTGQLASNATQIDIVFNNGLTALNDSGNRVSTSVTLQVHYRLTGETAWNLYATKTYADSTAQPLRKSIEIKHTTAGQYDIKVTRLTADKAEDDSYLYNEFYWSILRSISYADPVTFDCPIAETQIVIKATDQLSGNVDTINGVCQSVCLDYDATTDTWIKRATKNPASLFRYVLQGGGCAKVIEGRLIDIPALEEWHTFCEDNEFYYNYVHDSQQSTLDVLNDICHAGRATFVLLDSIRSVVIDRRRTLGAVQMFTPANSVNFSMKKTFAEEIHGYRINFNNEESDYAEDEVFSYAEGYTKANATLLEALEFVGVTNPTHVQKLGKYHLATRIYRSELFTWEADWEHVVCSRGDLVRLSNPAILVAQCSGLVIAVDRDNKTITLDQDTQFTAGKEYGLAVRTTPSSTDASVVYTLTVTADDEDATILHYTEGNAPVFTRGDVYSFGELGLEAIDVIITSKRPSSNMRATLTAIQYSWDEIEAYLAGEYPDHNSVITAPVYDNPAKPPVPSFASITGGAAAVKKNADGSITGRVIALVTVPSGNVAVSEVHVEIRESGGSWTRSANLDPADAFIFENIDDGTVELRARTATESGLYSAWFYTSYVQDAVYSAPSPITALDADGAVFANKLAWTLPADFASASMIEVWCSGDTNNRGLAELVGTIGQSTSWTHTTLDPTLVYYYWLRVRTAEDKYSTYFPVSTSGGIGASPSTSPDILLKQLQGERIDTNLGIDGDLVATGTITSAQMATHDLFAWSIISEDYVPGVRGYLLDAANNIAEFNDINLNLNYATQEDIDAAKTYNTSLLNMDSWVVGGTGSQGSYSQNGSTTENTIVLGTDDLGNVSTKLWRAGNDVTSDDDGGWNNTISTAGGYDPTKKYRLCVFAKQNSKSGTVYIGCSRTNTSTIAGEVSSNPYFWLGDLPTTGKWYLLVGIIHGSDYSGDSSGVSGVYDPETGKQVIVGTDYKSTAGATSQAHRVYHYYNTVLNDYAWFTKPRFDLADGNELPLLLLFSTAATVTSQSLDVGLDTDTGGLIVRNTTTSDYAHLSAGELNFYYWDGTNYDLYNTVRRIEAGVAANNTLVTIPGIFKSTPKVMVSPASLQTYIASSTNVDQKLVLRTNTINESPVGSGKYQFTPTATLDLSSGTTGVLMPQTIVNCSTYDSVSYSTYYHTLTKSLANTVTTPVTESLRVYGTLSYNTAYTVSLYLVVDGVDILAATTTGTANRTGSTAVDFTKAVTSSTHVVGLKVVLTTIYKYSEANGVCGSKNYVFMYTNSYWEYESLNPAATALVTLVSNITATSTLATGSLNWLAIGQ